MRSAEDAVPPPKWSPVQQALHWLVVGLCLAQIPTSWAIARTHVAHQFGLAPQPADLLLHKVHAVAGGLIFLAALLRLGLRFTSRRGFAAIPTPTPPSERARRLELLASATHVGLYALIVVLPLTGFLAMYVTGVAAPVHRLATKALLGLATFHAAAAFVHAAVFRDDVLTRMLPGRRGRSR